jgi:hypothetical protein
MSKHHRLNVADVLAWLQTNHPTLHDQAEVERAWVWLPVDLRKDPETRQAIKDFGFRFARRGHLLPSGKIGTWGHSCTHPMPFKRSNKPAQSRPSPASEPAADPYQLDAEITAFLEMEIQ